MNDERFVLPSCLPEEHHNPLVSAFNWLNRNTVKIQKNPNCGDWRTCNPAQIGDGGVADAVASFSFFIPGGPELRPFEKPIQAGVEAGIREGRSLAARESGNKERPTPAGTTRSGVRRTNPADWRRQRDAWDNAGMGDILSTENRAKIAQGRAPRVDDAWVQHFPGDQNLVGERITMHHINGSPLTVPLPESRHLDSHMPGGFRNNPGGPGTTG